MGIWLICAYVVGEQPVVAELSTCCISFPIVFLASELFIMASETLSMSGCDKKLLAILKTLAKASLKNDCRRACFF